MLWQEEEDTMCHELDGRGERCTVQGAHTEVTNSKGQRAVAHETQASVPVVGIILPRRAL